MSEKINLVHQILEKKYLEKKILKAQITVYATLDFSRKLLRGTK